MGNNWMCFCKRGSCGWNTTHTSKFHAAWSKNKGSFSLPATHEFRKKTAPADDSSGINSSLSSTGTGGSAGGATGAVVGAMAGFVAPNKEKTKEILEHYMKNSDDSDLSSFASDLHTAWNLN